MGVDLIKNMIMNKKVRTKTDPLLVTVSNQYNMNLTVEFMITAHQSSPVRQVLKIILGPKYLIPITETSENFVHSDRQYSGETTSAFGVNTPSVYVDWEVHSDLQYKSNFSLSVVINCIPKGSI